MDRAYLIDQLINKIDITEFISKNVDLKNISGKHYGACPFHENAEQGTFCVFPLQKEFKCYDPGCAHSGDVVLFHSLYEGISLDKAIVQLSEKHLGLILDEHLNNASKVKNKHVSLRIITEYSKKKLTKNNKALSWLHNMGITDAMIEKYDIGCGTGNMHIDLSEEIDFKVMESLGVISPSDQELKDLIKKDYIMIPVATEEGKLSHWHFLSYTGRKNMYQIPKKKQDRHPSSGFFNPKGLIENNDIILVANPLDAILIHETTGKTSSSWCEEINARKIEYLKNIRETVIFEEEDEEAEKTIRIWGEWEEKGYTDVRKLAFEISKMYKTLIMKPEGDESIPEVILSGKSLKSIPEIVIYSHPYQVERIKDQIYLHTDKEKKRLTNFILKPIYEYVDDDNLITREVEIYNIAEGVKTYEMDMGETLCTKRSFIKWLQRRGKYIFFGTDNNLIDYLEYINYTDNSKRVKLSQDYGEVWPDTWVFNNGVIRKGDITYSEDNKITWIYDHGFDGVRTVQDKKEKNSHARLQIPEEYYTIRQITEEALEFYPPWMVKIMLGYGAMCACRDEIAGKYGYFPLLLLFGKSGHGKSRFCALIRSLLGAGQIPAHTCKSTGKGFLRDFSKYFNIPLELSEYGPKFEAYLRHIFDLDLYIQAKNTVGKETYAPKCQAAAIFTSELTPKTVSLLNRCIMVDFNKKENDSKKAKSFKNYWSRMVNQNNGIGFLIELTSGTLKSRIINIIEKLEKDIIENSISPDSRIIELHAALFGGYVGLYNDENTGIHELFPDESPENLVKEITEMIENEQKMVQGQDRLYLFFRFFRTIFVTRNDYIKKVAKIEDEHIIFHMESVFDEVIAYDNQRNKYLENVQKEDILQRLFLKFPENDASEYAVRLTNDKESVIVPLTMLKEEFNISFMDIEGVNPIFDTDLY